MAFAHFDILGPYTPKSEEGNRYILLYICAFSKYIELVPLKDMKSYTIAHALVNDIFLRHGTPSILVSDKAVNLISQVMSDLFSILKVTRETTTAFHQQSNSMAERCVQTIKAIFNTIIENKQEKWQQYLNYVRCAYVNTVHASTNESPHFIMHLSDFRFPYSALAEPEFDRTFYNYDTDYRNLMIKRSKETFKIVENQLKGSYEKQKLYYDKTAKEKHIEIGSRVFLRNEAPTPGISTGFKAKFTGPYRVIEFDDRNNAVIKPIYGTAKEQTVHQNRLKLATERNFALKHLEIELKNQLDIEQKDQPQQSINLDSDEEIYELMDQKKTTRQVRFAEEDAERISPPLFKSAIADGTASGAAALENDRESAAASENASPQHSEENSDSEEETLVGNDAFNFEDNFNTHKQKQDSDDESNGSEKDSDDDSQNEGGKDTDEEGEEAGGGAPAFRNPDSELFGNTHGPLTDFGALDPHTTRFKTGHLKPNRKYDD